jgi:SAM-dependent methyltransferase
MPDTDSPFTNLIAYYDALIDWPKRLASEGPFFRQLFARLGAKRVLDAACGPGHHAAMFHSWGLEVEGADISPEMIKRAQQQHGEPQGLRWIIRGFEQLVDAPGYFDAAICVGNSLALVADAQAAAHAVAQMLSALRPGGMLVVQVLNFARLPSGPCRWQKCVRTNISGEDVFILKGVHACSAKGYVDLVVVPLSTPSRMHSESVPLHWIEAEELVHAAGAAGADHVELLGSYSGEVFHREQSVDLVLLARRPT